MSRSGEGTTQPDTAGHQLCELSACDHEVLDSSKTATPTVSRIAIARCRDHGRASVTP